MSRRKHTNDRQAGPLVYAMLTICVVLSAFPLYWILVTSSRSNEEMNAVPPPLTPGANLISNITAAFGQAKIGLALINSTWVAAVIALGTVLTSALAGFALSALKMRGRNKWMIGILGTMMIPLQLGIIPLFMIMAGANLVGNPWAVVLPYLASAFGVYFMKQYFDTALPHELIEAGYVDGATTRRIFWLVVLPIARPGMAVLAMLTFMTAWNEFFWPIVVLNPTNPTVQVAISQLGQGYVHDRSVIMAGTLVCTLPVIIAFAVLGKQITSGLLQGAVKA
ncbi:MAG TPA: carbohydrate ABC transporter permease [Arachnia sp.]|nr:carbohydrate ABC transporter permease [Arachnia sp.]